jgi:hypothetical protein
MWQVGRVLPGTYTGGVAVLEKTAAFGLDDAPEEGEEESKEGASPKGGSIVLARAGGMGTGLGGAKRGAGGGRSSVNSVASSVGTKGGRASARGPQAGKTSARGSVQGGGGGRSPTGKKAGAKGGAGVGAGAGAGAGGSVAGGADSDSDDQDVWAKKSKRGSVAGSAAPVPEYVLCFGPRPCRQHSREFA